ncbi:MAG: EhaE family protein [Methanobacteriaceae archaeon]|nr:EhaE family protein [Candidatus Methanorudis spinitermitis]
MIEVEMLFYTGCILAILGSIATVAGPGVKDPIVRTFNTEIAAIGVSLIFLAYNHTLALMTFVAATAVITLVLLRAITRLEEMGADV